MDNSRFSISDEDLLDSIQRQAFTYFEHHANPRNGLMPDSSQEGSPSSIAATGLALSTYPVAVERDFLKRDKALQLTLAALRFFAGSDQSGAKNASGFHGFYFHFLDMKEGKRAWKSELSSIDTALLLMGALTAEAYFNADTTDEREVRDLSQMLCERTNWNWMRAGRVAVGHGWKPECGFLKSQWTGYNEALIIYVLGLGASSNALPVESYRAWTERIKWKKIYDHEFVNAGPLFIHQMAQCWLDLKGLPDEYMRAKEMDYFENSRRATIIQREYAIRNPRELRDYDENCWGVSACDGPGPQICKVAGKPRRFYGYQARGVPYGPDDGTLAPWAVAASLPFCPEIVLPALRYFNSIELGEISHYSFEATFNPTFPAPGSHGWVSPHQLGLNQGPIVLMLENYRSGFVWKLLRDHPMIKRGLQRAGFEKK